MLVVRVNWVIQCKIAHLKVKQAYAHAKWSYLILLKLSSVSLSQFLTMLQVSLLKSQWTLMFYTFTLIMWVHGLYLDRTIKVCHTALLLPFTTKFNLISSSTGGCCVHQQNARVFSHHADDFYWRNFDRVKHDTSTRTGKSKFYHQSGEFTQIRGHMHHCCKDHCRKQCRNVWTQWSSWSW